MATLILIKISLYGQPGGAPEFTGFVISDIDVLTPIIFHQILMPAGNAIKLGMVQPTESPTTLGDRQTIATIGQYIYPGFGRPGSLDDIFSALLIKIAQLRFELTVSIHLGGPIMIFF